MSHAAEAALVARQLAALRRERWSLAEALELIIGSLAEAPLRQRLTEARALVMAGGSSTSTDPLVATLARGDRASPAVLDRLAESFEAAEQASASLRLARWTFGLGGGFALALITAFAWAAPSLLTPLVGEGLPPLPAQASLLVLELMQWVGPLLLVGWLGVVLRSRFTSAWSGARQLNASARLLELSGGLEAGLSAELVPQALGLTAAEQAWLSCAQERDGLANATASLAAQLLAEGVRAARVDRLKVTVALGLGFFVFGGSTLTAIYLSVFSIAGRIK
jgi:hypothetical protein